MSNALIAQAESTKTSGYAATNGRHIQSSNSYASVCEPASEDAQKETSEISSNDRNQSADAAAIRSTYPLSSVIEACPQVLDFAPSGVRSWQDLIETTGRIRPMLGISPTAWSDAQEAMGQEAAAITLAAILERHDSIKNAGGYLRSLTERKRAGKILPQACPTGSPSSTITPSIDGLSHPWLSCMIKASTGRLYVRQSGVVV